jgi:hypothetical protein
MKSWKRILSGSLAALVILWLVVMVRGGTIIRQAINQAGPQVLGVDVTVEDVSFLPLQGRVQLKNLHVGNPKGYKTDGIFDLGLVEVKLTPSSLLSDTIIIESVKIEGPAITYERGLGNSNIGALLEKLEGEKKEGTGEQREKDGKAEKKKAGGGKKVIIRDLQVNGAQVKVSLTALQGLAAPIPLPPVHLTGIGEESGGTSFGDALGRIIGAILGAVSDVVMGAGKLVGDGVTAVGGVAVDGAKAVGGAAADGAKAAGGAAADGAKAVGDAAGKLTEGLGNLIKGK